MSKKQLPDPELDELLYGSDQPAPETSTAQLAEIGESSRVTVARAFEALGGEKALVAWGKKQPEKFYALWSRLCTPRTDPRTGAAPRGRYPTSGGGGKAAVRVTDFTDD